MTTPQPPQYDLRLQPWVPALTLDGRVVHLGLVEVFERAPELRCLLGDLPTQSFALLRLLLALLHRAVPWDRDAGTAQWRDAWTGEVDVAAAVATHLGQHADRFDLRHPVTPFFQVADLRTAKGATSPLTTLVADVPNNEQFFATRAGRGLRELTAAEAARWLVHAHAYDPSGIKSGAVGDARVKGGKGYPIGTGWCGGIGGVFVEGRTLQETLLLNLVLDAPGGPAGDSAVWERPPHTSSVEAPGRHPTGQADLLTWQSRRVLLHWTGDVVTAALVANGDPLARQNATVEQMTSWRRSRPQEKALRQHLVYMPWEHDPARSLWRGLPSLLPGTSMTSGTGGEPAERRASGLLEWLGRCVFDGALPRDHPIALHATGMTYGSQSSVVDDVVDDALPLRPVLLGDRGEALRTEAVLAVRASEDAVRWVGYLAGDLAAAGGGSGPGADGAADRAREAAYFDLDAPFRAWLDSLTVGVDPVERRTAWEATVRGLLEAGGRDLVDAAGRPAWVGREVRGQWLDSAVAWEKFTAGLGKALVTTAAGTTPRKGDAA